MINGNSVFRIKKGQTRVVGEMLFFAIGVLILSYIIITFGIVQTGVHELSRNDQLQSVANYIKTGTIRLTNLDNLGGTEPGINITIELPQSIAGEDYGIELSKDGDNKLTVFLLSDPNVYVTEELFNIGSDYNIEESVFTGNARYYILMLNGNAISMEYYRFE